MKLYVIFGIVLLLLAVGYWDQTTSVCFVGPENPTGNWISTDGFSVTGHDILWVMDGRAIRVVPG
jgi:hypothetical protein